MDRRRNGATEELAAGGAFAGHVSHEPVWLEGLAPVGGLAAAPPRAADLVVVGAGYTGLHAALAVARAGRSVVVLDAGAFGAGCSGRNGGQISTSVKPSLAKLAAKFGAERARAIRGEGRAALEWIGEFVARERIDCDFARAGRFHAAHSPAAYEALAREAEALRSGEGIEAEPVPRREQRSELGTDFYHGGVVYPRHASLHPAKYLRGLLERAVEAGATVVHRCAALSIERTGGRFAVRTETGEVAARDVAVATNGYTSRLTPWLRRRVIPIGSYIIATEELPEALVDRLFPTGRIASDTRKVVYYYRASPDRRRVVFGGRVSAAETDPRVSGPKLRAEMARIFPELAEAGISHSWLGSVAYTFDELAHAGIHDGMHYAMGYCGSGVSMASWLGMRMGQKILGLAEGRTAFDGLPFPTRPLYSGRPWFLPAMVALYRWRDEREQARAARAG